MPPKITNKAITRDEVLRLERKLVAKEAAKDALAGWYDTGYRTAQEKIPQMQIEENLRKVASIPGWRAQKGDKNGYVMLKNIVSGEKKPVILELDYEKRCTGGLTYRQLIKGPSSKAFKTGV